MIKFCYVLSTKKKWKKFYVLSDCPSLYIYIYMAHASDITLLWRKTTWGAFMSEDLQSKDLEEIRQAPEGKHGPVVCYFLADGGIWISRSSFLRCQYLNLSIYLSVCLSVCLSIPSYILYIYMYVHIWYMYVSYSIYLIYLDISPAKTPLLDPGWTPRSLCRDLRSYWAIPMAMETPRNVEFMLP